MNKELQCFNPMTGNRDGNYCLWESDGLCLKCQAADKIGSQEDRTMIDEEGNTIDVRRICKRFRNRIKELQKRVEELEKKLRHIQYWCDAYPLEVFPEPDLKKAREALDAYGITLDAVSASNMRHVLNGVRNIIDGDSK